MHCSPKTPDSELDLEYRKSPTDAVAKSSNGGVNPSHGCPSNARYEKKAQEYMEQMDAVIAAAARMDRKNLVQMKHAMDEGIE